MTIGPITRQAALTLKSGDKLAARTQLAQALQSGESSDEVFYWLAMAADVTDEKRHYLVKALEANPANEDARRLLMQITDKEVTSTAVKAVKYEYIVVPFQGRLQEGGGQPRR